MLSHLRHLRVRNFIVPLLLAALALRAFIPAGFMPGAGDAGFSVTVCSNQAGKTEPLQLPPHDSRPPCEYCFAPLLEAPLAFNLPRLPPLAPEAPESVPVAHSGKTTLQRAQSARAPPA